VYEMSENHTDAPDTPQEPVVHPTKPLWWFVCAHYSLVVLVTPIFLFCLLRLMLPPVNIKIIPRAGWPELLLIAGFIGLLMHKKWAYMLFVIISLNAEVLFIHSIISLYPTSGYKEYVQYAIWFGLILVVASICGLNCGRKQDR